MLNVQISGSIQVWMNWHSWSLCCTQIDQEVERRCKLTTSRMRHTWSSNSLLAHLLSLSEWSATPGLYPLDASNILILWQMMTSLVILTYCPLGGQMTLKNHWSDTHGSTDWQQQYQCNSMEKIHYWIKCVATIISLQKEMNLSLYKKLPLNGLST